jgi:hypothetical protein
MGVAPPSAGPYVPYSCYIYCNDDKADMPFSQKALRKILLDGAGTWTVGYYYGATNEEVVAKTYSDSGSATAPGCKLFVPNLYRCREVWISAPASYDLRVREIAVEERVVRRDVC